ncbi:hypothetical protein ACN38_g9844 [Penicillium nordicum]|uniref:Uncharacterized protein n=1 Tax=Penicillium nordicum TaxID=229535 RepID=A0A0M8P2H8_9EURO|nr:hypothetical protein ACN38_g9844 [Penicillium nordicum]
MRSVAARSSRPLKWVTIPDWLHGFLKLGDPDLASAVFPTYAESKAVLFVCIGCWEALSDHPGNLALLVAPFLSAVALYGKK